MARSTNSGGRGRTKNHSLLRALHTKQTGKYARQRQRTEANKLRKRLVHQQKNPNDRQEGTP